MFKKWIMGLLNPFAKIDSDLVIQKDGHSYIRMTGFIESAMYPAIIVPFNGIDQTIIVRKLTGIQRDACGEFSLIETVRDKMINKNKKLTYKEMCDYSRLQYEIVKRSLVSPTYEEIMKLNEFDILRLNAEKELNKLEPIINNMDDGIKKNKLKDDYYMLEMNSKYLLPEDFITHVMSYALRLIDSDLKDITADMLYEAAILAKRGGGRPSDYMPGNLADHHLKDIDKRAYCEYANRETNNNRKRGA